MHEEPTLECVTCEDENYSCHTDCSPIDLACHTDCSPIDIDCSPDD